MHTPNAITIVLDWFVDNSASVKIVGLSFVFVGVMLSISNQVSRFFEARGLFGSPVPISHKIAILGLPGSGKTTLITAIFELIQMGVHTPGARLHGLQTIARVNKMIALLNSEREVGPTMEKDIFVFRFSYVRTRLLSRSNYDVEIADFPGEYSERIESKPIPLLGDDGGNITLPDFTLFNQEFFSWIASSRVYVFVINLAKLYGSVATEGNIADLIGRIRTSWQVIEDATSERGLGTARSRPILIVYSKLDCLVGSANEEGMDAEEIVEAEDGTSSRTGGLTLPGASSVVQSLLANKAAIRRREANSRLNTRMTADQQIVDEIIAYNDSKFEQLTQFFKARSKTIKITYASMAFRDNDGTRWGVMNVLRAILP